LLVLFIFLLYDALNLASLRLCASAILVSFLAGVARGFFFPLSSFGLLPVRGRILFPRLGSAAWIGVYSLRFFPREQARRFPRVSFLFTRWVKKSFFSCLDFSTVAAD
jgi:hypothetical protein